MLSMSLTEPMIWPLRTNEEPDSAPMKTLPGTRGGGIGLPGRRGGARPRGTQIDLPGDGVGSGDTAENTGMARLRRTAVQEAARRNQRVGRIYGILVRHEEDDVLVRDVHRRRSPPKAPDLQDRSGIPLDGHVRELTVTCAQGIGMGHAQNPCGNPDSILDSQVDPVPRGVPDVEGVVA